MRHTVSVVIITMNRPKEIRQCVPCLFSQNLPPEEIIIVDASTSQDTERAVHDLQKTSAIPLRYFKTHPGTGHQRKLGVEKCSGDVVLFVDDDVLLENDFISEIIQLFNREWERIGGVTGHNTESRRLPRLSFKALIRTIFFLQDFGSGKFKLSCLHTTANGLKGIREVEYMGGAFTAYRSSVLAEFPPDHERFSFFFEDADLSFRVSRKYRNYYTSSARCRHLPSPVNRQSVQDKSKELLKAYRLFWEKNSPKNWLHQQAYSLACYGIRNKLVHMTFRDFASQCYRSIVPRKENVPSSKTGVSA